jgi:glycerophosphoryl diester phosphodiesterase
MTGMLIVGHRGAMAHAPENSLESYALAEEAGVDEIELDVRLSADEQLFLLHDATLDRTAGADSARGLGPAAELTMAQLQAAVLDSGRGVVSLAEMYEATSTGIQLEIKAPETVPHLARYFAEHRADAERTVLMSFQEDALHEAARLMPQVRRGVIRKDLATADAFPGGWQGLVEHTRAQRLAVGLEGLTEEAAAQIRDQGLELHVWPMRSLENMRDAMRLQADGTTSDDPALAMQWLREVQDEQASEDGPATADRDQTAGGQAPAARAPGA